MRFIAPLQWNWAPCFAENVFAAAGCWTVQLTLAKKQAWKKSLEYIGDFFTNEKIKTVESLKRSQWVHRLFCRLVTLVLKKNKQHLFSILPIQFLIDKGLWGSKILASNRHFEFKIENYRFYGAKFVWQSLNLIQLPAWKKGFCICFPTNLKAIRNMTNSLFLYLIFLNIV